MPSILNSAEDGDLVTAIATTTTTSPSQTHARRASLKALNRNIDDVVLGNLVFKTWYFSPFPESIIFGPDYHPTRFLTNGEGKNGHGHGHNQNYHQTDKPDTPPIARLHVCPYCFRYTTKPDDYALHLHHHLQQVEESPQDWRPVPDTAIKVYEWDGYTVWDVDGEIEKLYCQNLSLFGKLFLEQKSVFFDTAGFHYFVLTYTPPAADGGRNTGHAARPRTRKRASSGLATDLGLQTQVMGFFSKENLSWDANNLACILVFPPFQRRSLGQLLMAVSYKLSGWEWEDSIIGGPEKPLSVMGRRSYLRFWSERIARFFMGQTTDADGKNIFHRTRKTAKRVNFAKEEMTVKEIGDRTGMLAEDVVAALNEMGLCEKTPPRRRKKTSSLGASTTSDCINDRRQGVQENEEALVPSVTIKRSHVLAWAERHEVDLTSPVKEEGFVGEWALSDIDGDAAGSDDQEPAEP